MQPVAEREVTSGILPSVSVIVLSYARPRFFAEALESVVRQSYPNLEIVVVDNPSDASPEIAGIVARYRHVKLIQNRENLGFATGMNVGIQNASGEYIYLTEDDMVLRPDCVSELVQLAQAEPGLGLMSGLIYHKQSGTILCAGGDLVLGSMLQIDLFGSGEEDQGRFPAPFDVTYISGAMVFASRQVWNSLGGFRDEFFMYLEDVELCLRARRLGYRITIVPAAKALHFERTPGPTPDIITFHKLKNYFSVYILHAPFSVLLKFALRQMITDIPLLMITDRVQAPMLWRALRATWASKGRLWRERRAWKARETRLRPCEPPPMSAPDVPACRRDGLANSSSMDAMK